MTGTLFLAVGVVVFAAAFWLRGGQKDRKAAGSAGTGTAVGSAKTGGRMGLFGLESPAEGGKISAYKDQGRNRSSGAWPEVVTAIETEATFAVRHTAWFDQLEKTELESRQRRTGIAL